MTSLLKNSYSCSPQIRKGVIFTLIWGVVNLIQALFTELHFDEAYYALYADHLAWGYFDHPPAIALLIWISKHLVAGSLGIRLFNIILLPFTLWLFWETLPHDQHRSDPLLFLWITAAIPYIQIIGFVATPDTPLLFTYALILYASQAFLKQERMGEVFLFALAMALSMYSKYHAALFIVLLIGANPRLLQRPKFYIAGVIALLLWTPHLLWEYQHDWITIRFHLFDRSRNFDWKSIIEYLWNIPVSFNPLLVIPFIYYRIRWKHKSPYDRTLTLIAIGFWVFFFLSAFRDRVQPQWVLPVLFCIVWTLYRTGIERPSAKAVIQKLAGISIVIILAARILLMCNLDLKANIAFFKNRQSYTALATLTQGAPLVMNGNYGMAAHYAWYSGHPVHCQSSVNQRDSQFSIWQFDTAFYGKEVWVECPDSLPLIPLPNHKNIALQKVDFFIPVSRIEITPVTPPREASAGDSLTITLVVENRYDFIFPMSQVDGTRLHAVWKRERSVQIDFVLPDKVSALAPRSVCFFPVTIPVPEKPGFYQLGFSVERAPLPYGFALPPQKVKVISKK